MSRFVASVRGFWRAFRKGPDPKPRHSGHDLARTAKDAYNISSRGGSYSGGARTDQHVTGGARDYAKSFDKGK